MQKRWMSRKFLLSILMLLGAAALVMKPEAAEEMQTLAQIIKGVLTDVAAIVAAGAAVWKYLTTEGALALEALKNGTPKRK